MEKKQIDPAGGDKALEALARGHDLQLWGKAG